MVYNRYTAAHLAGCFRVVMLALWSSSSVAALFAICFLYLFSVLLLGTASGDKGVFSRWFKLTAVNFSKVPFQGFVRLWFHMWSLFCHCFLLDSPSFGASGLGGSGTVRSDYAIFCVFPLLTFHS